MDTPLLKTGMYALLHVFFYHCRKQGFGGVTCITPYSNPIRGGLIRPKGGGVSTIPPLPQGGGV